MHATEFLAAKQPIDVKGMLVLYGAERFFRHEVLQRIPGASGEEADLSLTRIAGEMRNFAM